MFNSILEPATELSIGFKRHKVWVLVHKQMPGMLLQFHSTWDEGEEAQLVFAQQNLNLLIHHV